MAKNRLCPCGSGKKYRKCCKGKHQAEGALLAGRLGFPEGEAEEVVRFAQMENDPSLKMDDAAKMLVSYRLEPILAMNLYGEPKKSVFSVAIELLSDTGNAEKMVATSGAHLTTALALFCWEIARVRVKRRAHYVDGSEVHFIFDLGESLTDEGARGLVHKFEDEVRLFCEELTGKVPGRAMMAREEDMPTSRASKVGGFFTINTPESINKAEAIMAEARERGLEMTVEFETHPFTDAKRAIVRTVRLDGRPLTKQDVQWLEAPQET